MSKTEAKIKKLSYIMHVIKLINFNIFILSHLATRGRRELEAAKRREGSETVTFRHFRHPQGG